MARTNSDEEVSEFSPRDKRAGGDMGLAICSQDRDLSRRTYLCGIGRRRCAGSAHSSESRPAEPSLDTLRAAIPYHFPTRAETGVGRRQSQRGTSE